MKGLICFSIFIWTQLFVSPIYGIKRYTNQYDFEKGNPTQIIYDLHLHRSGLLYMGTNRGIVKFNGINFELMGISTEAYASMDNLQEDANGVLWCKNFNNQIFYLENGAMLPFPLPDSLQKEQLNQFEVIEDGLLLLYPKKLLKLNFNGTSKLIMRLPEFENKQYFFQKIFTDIATESIFFYDFKNIYSYTAEGVNIENQNVPGFGDVQIFNNEFYFASKSGDGQLLNLSKNKIINITKTQLRNINHLRICDGKLWLCSNEGIFQLNQSKSVFENQLFDDFRTSDIVSDGEGNFWISTLDFGLIHLPPAEIYFKTFKALPFDNFITYEIIDDNLLFLGTEQGNLLALDHELNMLNIYPKLSGNQISFIKKMDDRRLFFSHGIVDLKLNKPIKKMDFGKHLSKDLLGNFTIANSFYSGIINSDLSGQPNGVFENPEALFLEEQIPFIGLLKKRSYKCLQSNEDSSYYMLTNSGVWRLGYPDLQLEQLQFQDQEIMGSCMIDSQDSSIWVGTAQNTIVKFKDGKISKVFSREDGLRGKVCKSLFEYGNYIYALSDEGINIINQKTGNIAQIHQADYIKYVDFNEFFVLKDKIYLLSNKGVHLIFLQKFYRADNPAIFIKNILVNNKKWPEGKALILNQEQRNINIEIEPVVYSNPKNLKIFYRLNGFEHKWNTTKVLPPQINYLSLPYGNFEFEIYCQLGDYKSEITTLQITVRTPFYMRWWFLLVSLFFTVAVVIFIYQFNIKRERKKQIIKEQLINSRLTALRAQMNPHFVFNVLNSIQGLIYGNKKEEATEYLGKFSDLMRQFLENSDKQWISISEEIAALKSYLALESSRFDGDFTYEITVADEISEQNYEVPNMLIQPFVENALKHGLLHKSGDKFLSIHFIFIDKSKMLQVIIEDNGIGRTKSNDLNAKKNKHKSFATNAVYNRINLLNSIIEPQISIEIQDLYKQAMPSGTRVILRIQFK